MRLYKFILFVLIYFSYSASSWAIAGSNEVDMFTEQLAVFNDASTELKVLGSITLLSFLPIIAVSMTAFLRIVIVLSLLRHALGIQQTPPNIALIALGLFLTFFTMQPTFSQINQYSLIPYQKGELPLNEAVYQGYLPLKSFMVSQTRERDIAAISNIANKDIPQSVEELELYT